jgi:hypothetical protein
MTPGRIGWELAATAILCVLTVFLFPAIEGPYSVVHGPVTALQSARAAARVRMAIVHGALNSLGNWLAPVLEVLSWMSLSEKVFQLVGSSEYNTVLRC